jgi:AcrR family transcriptional regulator
MTATGKKALQSASTRRRILDAATALFAEHGYADTPIDDVVRRAGVTRGALYHHFESKETLFRAVVADVACALSRTMTDPLDDIIDPWLRLHAICAAFLDMSLDSVVQRVILLDAPAVLDPEDVRAIDEDFTLGLIRQQLEAAVSQGLIERQGIEPMAHLLRGALGEGIMLIARAKNTTEMRAVVGATMNRLLRGLRTNPDDEPSQP